MRGSERVIPPFYFYIMDNTIYDKLVEYIEIFKTHYIKNVEEIFQREFSEENVECHYPIIDTPSFLNEFLRKFHIYRDAINPAFPYSVYSDYRAALYNSFYVGDFSDRIISDIGAVVDLPNEEVITKLFDTIDLKDFFFTMITPSNYAKIIIHFPEVIVKNERGQSTRIKNLFAEVKVKADGTLLGEFKLNRTHYIYNHFLHNYLHSHVCAIPTWDFREFQNCCLGTGPIRHTIHNLHQEYNESQWMQFCWDLSKYVTIESEEGVPYHYLSRSNTSFVQGDEIRTDSFGYNISGFQKIHVSTNMSLPEHMWGNFAKYLIDTKSISFRWVNKHWEIAAGPIEHIKNVSTSFLKFLRSNYIIFRQHTDIVESLFSRGVLKKVIININGIYKLSTSSDRVSRIDDYRGKYALTFKGEDYCIEIDEPTEPSSFYYHTILDVNIIAIITGIILKILNIKYGKRSETNPSELEISFTDF